MPADRAAGTTAAAIRAQLPPGAAIAEADRRTTLLRFGAATAGVVAVAAAAGATVIAPLVAMMAGALGVAGAAVWTEGRWQRRTGGRVAAAIVEVAAPGWAYDPACAVDEAVVRRTHVVGDQAIEAIDVAYGLHDGRGLVVTAVRITVKSGSESSLAFDGHVAVIPLDRPRPGHVAVVPDALERHFGGLAGAVAALGNVRDVYAAHGAPVRFDEDPAFERLFVTYESAPGLARALLRPALRALLAGMIAGDRKGALCVDGGTAWLAVPGGAALERPVLWRSELASERLERQAERLGALVARVRDAKALIDAGQADGQADG